MIKNNELIKNKKFLLFVFILLFVLLIFVSVILFHQSQNNVLIIDNIDNYINNLPDSRKNYVQKTLYSYVNKQNEIVGTSNENLYHGIIRDESIQISYSEVSEHIVYTTKFILDIPNLQYSYKTSFSWLEKDTQSSDVDLGSVTIYCLSEKESIYPDFNCNQNPIVSTETDSLLSINLIINENCWMSPFSSVESQSGYGVDIFYHPNDSDYKNDTINSSYNQCIENAKEYLISNGLKLDNYKIRSEIKHFYNY